MANAFNKEEIVAFEDMLDQFNDELVMSSIVSKYNTSPQQMERASDVIWRPQPYIATSDNVTVGTDVMFRDSTQLSVPSTISIHKVSTANLTATEARDAAQEGWLGKAAIQKLASDVNTSLLTEAADKGSIVITNDGVPQGYGDIAVIDATLNELGIPMQDRYLALNSRDYNDMASNLAARATMNQIPTRAYRDSYVGRVAGFETFKLDYGKTLAANKIGATAATINGGNQKYVPKATSTATSTGETENVDNRTMTLNVTTAVPMGETVSQFTVGDCIQIENVYAVHHITKTPLEELKTFRVTAVSTTDVGDVALTITPPIISAVGTGTTQAELQYKNCSATPANDDDVILLNTKTRASNIFWHKDAIQLIPGTIVVPSNTGLATMSGTTPQGIQLTMSKSTGIGQLTTNYRWDVRFGVNVVQPEMCGVALFDQP